WRRANLSRADGSIPTHRTNKSSQSRDLMDGTALAHLPPRNRGALMRSKVGLTVTAIFCVSQLAGCTGTKPVSGSSQEKLSQTTFLHNPSAIAVDPTLGDTVYVIDTFGDTTLVQFDGQYSTFGESTQVANLSLAGASATHGLIVPAQGVVLVATD